MKKKYLIIFMFLVIAAVFIEQILLIDETIKTSKSFYKAVLNNQTVGVKNDYEKLLQFNNRWQKRIIFINKISGSRFLSGRLSKWVNIVNKTLPLVPEILSFNGEKTYFVLLQNNMELRPTGGFMGSYAKLKFINGGLADVQFQDIYVPDGQIQSHVDPPIPIEKAFGNGTYKLRDSNFNPDFSQSAETINWFFEKGGEVKPDAIIAVNLNPLKDLLKIVGPLELADYQQTVDESNFYQVVQSESETGFFPGSTQKTSIINAVGKAFLWKIKNIDSSNEVPLFKTLMNSLDQKEILLYFKDGNIQKIISGANWDGKIPKLDGMNNRELNDYLYLVEANLGANKANLYVDRKIKHIVDFTPKQLVKEDLIIDYKNTGKYYTPIKPDFFGGDYTNYLRIFIPVSSVDIKVQFDGKEIPAKEIDNEKIDILNLRSIGFFIKIPYSSQKTVKISYEIPLLIRPSDYNLSYQKQPGIAEVPYQIKVINGKFIEINEGVLIKDQQFRFNLEYN